MKTNVTKWMLLLMVGLMTTALCGCGSDDDDNDNSDGGIYGNQSGIMGWYANSQELNGNVDGILELLIEWEKEDLPWNTEPKIPDIGFNSQGEIVIGGGVYHGDPHIVYQITSANTMVKHYGEILKLGASKATGPLLYSFYNADLGALGVYSYRMVNFTFQEIDGILYSTDDIFILTDGGFYIDGTSDYYTKYNPNNY